MRLRDEKVALVRDSGETFYCLFLQAQADKRPKVLLRPEDLVLGKSSIEVPSWILPKPPPRKPNEKLHPAKYPETLITEFIELFSSPGDWVLDPMVGTGSTVLAALRSARNGLGIELNPDFAEIARDRLQPELEPTLFSEEGMGLKGIIVTGDASELDRIPELLDLRFRYAVTSPPYWSMLTNPGSENQRARRQDGLPLVYSQDNKDVGNISDYDEFLELLKRIYSLVALVLEDDGLLTVVVKNVKREHVVYPLAWDLVRILCSEDGPYEYIDTTLWCQDDVGLKPFAVGIHWVSNTLHNYCLHFAKRRLSR